MKAITGVALLIAALIGGRGDPIDDLLRGAPTTGSPPSTITARPLPAPPDDIGACEAASLAYLIGRPKTEIPVPVNPSRRRVSCTTCPVTQDYSPDRTDILFDPTTGLVTAVKCG